MFLSREFQVVGADVFDSLGEGVAGFWQHRIRSAVPEPRADDGEVRSRGWLHDRPALVVEYGQTVRPKRFPTFGDDLEQLTIEPLGHSFVDRGRASCSFLGGGLCFHWFSP